MTDRARLIVDTNILIRCSIGRAMGYVRTLAGRGVVLTTTDRNVDEFLDRLRGKFGVPVEEAMTEATGMLGSFDIVYGPSYESARPDADRRLREGGKSDWPALAAAMSLDCAIWSEDVDFFGTGVPVWSTANVLLCAADTAA